MTTVSIYDVDNRYVGFSGSFSQVISVICEWGSVFVLASKGEQLFQLTEKDTQSKLEILYKKNLYQMAIELLNDKIKHFKSFFLFIFSNLSLAQSSQYDQEGVIDIIRQYADHLYG